VAVTSVIDARGTRHSFALDKFYMVYTLVDSLLHPYMHIFLIVPLIIVVILFEEYICYSQVASQNMVFVVDIDRVFVVDIDRVFVANIDRVFVVDIDRVLVMDKYNDMVAEVGTLDMVFVVDTQDMVFAVDRYIDMVVEADI
jgi:hypothetical protein